MSETLLSLLSEVQDTGSETLLVVSDGACSVFPETR